MKTPELLVAFNGPVASRRLFGSRELAAGFPEFLYGARGQESDPRTEPGLIFNKSDTPTHRGLAYRYVTEMGLGSLFPDPADSRHLRFARGAHQRANHVTTAVCEARAVGVIESRPQALLPLLIDNMGSKVSRAKAANKAAEWSHAERGNLEWQPSPLPGGAVVMGITGPKAANRLKAVQGILQNAYANQLTVHGGEGHGRKDSLDVRACNFQLAVKVVVLPPFCEEAGREFAEQVHSYMPNLQ